MVKIIKQAKIEIILQHLKDTGLRATVNYKNSAKIFLHFSFVSDEVSRIIKEFIKSAYLNKAITQIKHDGIITRVKKRE